MRNVFNFNTSILTSVVVHILFFSCFYTASDLFAVSSNYQGFGASSVDEKTLQKFAPPSLPEDLQTKIQSFLDIHDVDDALFTEDGNQMFFEWSVTGTTQIWRLDRKQSFPVQMTGGQDGSQLEAISPDGKYIVVQRDNKGDEFPGIYLQTVRGGPLIPIVAKADI